MHTDLLRLFRPRLAVGWSLVCALALLTLAALFPVLARAGDGLQHLQHFLQAVHAGQATFTQTVTQPLREGEPPRQRVSHGRFAFQRPGQFRFDYTRPFAQTIVADGHTLWLYDEDLQQVTRRSQSDALTNTPAALLTAARSLADLRRDFELALVPAPTGVQAVGEADARLQWVQATPRDTQGTLRSVRVGFDGPQLVALDMTDNFGQHSAIRFTNWRSIDALPVQVFDFQIPEGVDVLTQ